eukprot:134516-Chlamydomonas_euryale.AAC.1
MAWLGRFPGFAEARRSEREVASAAARVRAEAAAAQALCDRLSAADAARSSCVGVIYSRDMCLEEGRSTMATLWARCSGLSLHRVLSPPVRVGQGVACVCVCVCWRFSRTLGCLPVGSHTRWVRLRGGGSGGVEREGWVALRFGYGVCGCALSCMLDCLQVGSIYVGL